MSRLAFSEKTAYSDGQYDIQTGKISKRRIPIWEAYNIPIDSNATTVNSHEEALL